MWVTPELGLRFVNENSTRSFCASEQAEVLTFPQAGTAQFRSEHAEQWLRPASWQLQSSSPPPYLA
jgi:hypothetical protein